MSGPASPGAPQGMAKAGLLLVLLLAASTGCHLASTEDLLKFNPGELDQWEESFVTSNSSTEVNYFEPEENMQPTTWQDELDAEVAPGNWSETRHVRRLATCNYARGQWKWSKRRPFYSSNCPFIRTEYNCRRNGRKRTGYEKWYWKPFDCNLPRFSPSFLGKFLRGKSVALIGDSFTSNFGQALMCQMARQEVVVPYVSRIAGKRVQGVRVPKYDLKILLINAPYLVKYSKKAEDFAKYGLKQRSFYDYLVWVDKMDPAWSTVFKYIDLTIFMSGHWYQVKQGNAVVRSRNFIQNEKLLRNIPGPSAYALALKNIRKFVTKTVRYKGVPMYLTYSPSHYTDGTHCKATKPWSFSTMANYHRRQDGAIQWLKVEKGAMGGSRFRVIDVTFMSNGRPDGHVGTNYGVARNSKTKWDCTHWCLPGVPDAWTDVFQHVLRTQVMK